MFIAPEKYRDTTHPLMASSSRDGNNGYFKIQLSHRSTAHIIASDGEGWEHVSVHITEKMKQRTPTWAEMCKIKDLFWTSNDCVVQYHPAQSEYVNRHKHTLHLWRPINGSFPIPNKLLVG